MLRADLSLMVLAASSAAFGLALAAFLRFQRKAADGEGGARSQGPGSPLGALAWGLVAAVAGWAICAALYRLQGLGLLRGFDLPSLERLQWYFLLAQGLAFLLLTRLFGRRAPLNSMDPTLPAQAAGARRYQVVVFYAPVLYLAAGAAFFENWLGLRDLLFQVGRAPIYRWDVARAAMLVGLLGCLTGAALLTRRERRQNRAPLHRNRTRYWSTALGVLGAGQLLAALALLAPKFSLGALAAPLLMFGALAAVYAITTHHLPDLRSAARRVGKSTILVVAGLTFYALLLLGLLAALRMIPGDSDVLQWAAVGAALAVTAAGILHPLVRWLDRTLKRLFFGTAYDSRRTLAEYSSTISNVLDMEMLATISIGLISEALEIRRGALITVEPAPVELPTPADGLRSAGAEQPTLPHAGYRLRPITGMGEALGEGRLPTTSPAASSLRRERRPLTQFDLDLHPRYQSMQAAERAWWSSLQMDLYVPIYVKETWIGLLALGPKVSGDRYFDEDLAFVQTLADQTAVAFENARLFEHLKQRNAENERLNAELTAANVELSRLDQAKSNFINIASHELRTPLTQIMGYNDILSEMAHAELDNPDAVVMTDAVRKASRRLEEIVNTMFDVSKLDTRTLDLHMEITTLGTVLSAAGAVWREGMDERGLQLSITGLEDLPPVIGDAQRLTQVFANLIQNAIRATPDGGLISVTGRAVEQGAVAQTSEDGAGEEQPGWVEVVVSDTGIGIEQEELERIFDKFYRVGNVLLHSTGETKFKGAGPGLGLTIARGIVEAHGGRIWAESPGRDETSCPGSSFHVLLPAAMIGEEVG